MNESDANRAMMETASGRALSVDLLEQTQRMPVAERRGRQDEGRAQHMLGRSALGDRLARYADGLALAVDRQPWPDFRDGTGLTEADYHARNQRDGFES